MTNDRIPYFSDHFRLSEFDSPDLPGSGSIHMDRAFLYRLGVARSIAGIPFRINSGYRSPEYNRQLQERGYKTSPTSSHTKGLAADISTKNSEERYLILQSLLLSGFTRIGLGKNFIHVDTDSSKPQHVAWTY